MVDVSDDRGRSIERAWKKDDRRAKESGYGATPPGQAIIQKMLLPLMETIIAERRATDHSTYERVVQRVTRRRVANGSGAEQRRRPTNVLQAIEHISHFDVADRVLRAAVSLVYDPSLGRSKKSNTRNAARIIGQNLDQDDGPAAFRVGSWAISLLKEFGFQERGGDLLLPLIDGVGWDQVMTDTTARNAFCNPYLLPSHFPPTPWTDFDKGGLHSSKGWAQPKLVITKGKREIERAVRQAIRDGSMLPFLAAINALQRVAFRINAPVLRWTTEFGLTTSSFTDINKFGSPKKRKKWWPGTDAHKEIARQTAFSIAMFEAKILANGGQFFVPLHADARGRLYGVPHFNFGREDYIRGLFLFEWGEPIGEEGLVWLKAHVARSADGWRGERTKHLNLAGRAAWTEANLVHLYEVADAVERCAPIDGLPDDPIQFLAACLELKQANDNPEYITRLPIAFDGTCSGLQHLSALTKCEDEGRLANLIPSDVREDLYQVVADKTGETRKVAKGPCVSFFYGSAPGNWGGDKESGWQLKDGMIKEMLGFLKYNKFPPKNVTKRTRAIYKAICQTVPQAKKTQEFLRAVAKALFKHKKPLRWKTPLGFPVVNFYFDPIRKETKIKINRAEKSAIHFHGYDTNKPDTQAYTSAAANYVHSLDAAHLHMVAATAARECIAMVGVHDSFSCLAPRANRFKQIIGKQFCSLHENDLLADLLRSARADLPGDAKLPSPPDRGTLDLSPNSFFQFS
jgi:DNA-directed RNA polymerase